MDLARVLFSLMILLILSATMLFMVVSFGSKGLVLSTVPVTLASEGRTSSAAGISTSVFSIAGGIGNTLVDVIVDHYSWEHVFALWGALFLIGWAIAWANLGRERPQEV